MRLIFIILFLLPLFSEGQNNVYLFNAADGTPMKRYDTTITGWNARVLVRQDQDYNPDSTEVIIDVCGLGEVGTDTSLIDSNGYGYWISNARWDGTVALSSGNHHPIIVVLQPSSTWPGESTTSGKVDVILNRWRIKRRAVHVSGLSMGGWTWTTLVTSDAGSPYSRAFKITSVVESGGANPNENTPYPDLFDQFAIYGARGTGGKLLSFQQDLDARDALNRVNRMNSNAAGSYYIQTNFGTRGHSNFNDHYNPNTTNWTTSNAEVTSTTPSGGLSVSMAQWQLLQGDTTTNWSSPGSITADAGVDFWIPYDQGNAARSFTLTGTSFNATIPVYSWAALAGNPSAVTIVSPSSASTTVTGATTAGFYGFVLTVTENGNAEIQDKDTVYVQIRDLMLRGLRPCRTGTKQRFYIGNELIPGRVTTTEIYAQYLTRDGFLSGMMGGDTLIVHRNLNNDTGYWKAVHMGDFSGGPGCPIVVVPDTSGLTVVSAGAGGTRGWYVGAADLGDSNTVAYVKFDGGAWYNKTGIRHGFRADNRNATYDSSNTTVYSLNMGMAAQLIHHFEVTGFAVWNSGYVMQMKIYSDSTLPFTIWNNFRQRNIWIHDNYGWKTNYEGYYIGHTDWDGSYQSGNDGRTLMLDSLLIERNVLDMVGQDGIQVANHGPGAIVRNNFIYRSGYRNVSSHRWTMFIGGNANGKMYGNTVINGRGPAGSLGYGTVEFYNNVIDSINDGGNVESAIYVNQASWTGNTDSLKMRVYNNILRRIANTSNSSFVWVVNSAGLMGKGTISGNWFVHPTKTSVNQMVTTAVGDTVTNNTILTDLSLDTSFLANQESYRVYKELYLPNPSGTPISFHDLPTEGNENHHRGFKIFGRRFRFKL